MRDPKRIKRILKKIEVIWIEYPDFRLTQLIMNALALSRDPYHIEDDKLEKALDDLKERLDI